MGTVTIETKNTQIVKDYFNNIEFKASDNFLNDSININIVNNWQMSERLKKEKQTKIKTA